MMTSDHQSSTDNLMRSTRSSQLLPKLSSVANFHQDSQMRKIPVQIPQVSSTKNISKLKALQRGSLSKPESRRFKYGNPNM